MDIEKATAIFRKNYEKWATNDKRNNSGYDYEKTFVEMMDSLGKEVLQDSLGGLPQSRNLKKKSKRHTEK